MDTSRYAAPNARTPAGDAPRAAHGVDGLAFLAWSAAADEAATVAALENLERAHRQIAAPARGARRRASRALAHGSAAQSIHADEAVRHQLARDLHDSVGAELAATHFALANVHTWLPANAPPQCAEALALVARSLEAATGAMRHVLDGLHAPHLDAGLAPALSNWVCGFAARTGLAARVAGASDDARLARLPAEAALAVFRVAQEALANVARHAQATCAEVRLESTTRHLTLTIADDGIGLAHSASRTRRSPASAHGADDAARRESCYSGHYGLAGMRERCAAFGGSLRAVKGGIARTHHDDAQQEAAPCGTTVRARFAWDALLAGSHCASPLLIKEGARS
ncbi:sensor histidine kinase [Paraburkholderia silvatlantica]|uniref:histidine kinase n=1 Tax=Paraburkholderia silvatlantica TaxID=321895 RepID=A0A2U1AKK9_9BURK|nr:ATP-binding protein [Paraburkholderia silvatlantica]MBB2927199.1 signal transduction histidine kinase [Paraburkholderia silvatlantica]PVY36920.1 histidine kinase/DNA gyrase B/HSP90-like ATPase [Paraburkholderia silvatlantica]PXW41802.1 histidine kinase/DNA gyrase B/HSP90-like ATPase [Paraburkholderia silvatlantica]PYE26270.1 histidine kinase/DNA gyrase B/HSP90-like ATPase [Paraburkholderia silvatlantica]